MPSVVLNAMSLPLCHKARSILLSVEKTSALTSAFGPWKMNGGCGDLDWLELVFAVIGSNSMTSPSLLPIALSDPPRDTAILQALPISLASVPFIRDDGWWRD